MDTPAVAAAPSTVTPGEPEKAPPPTFTFDRPGNQFTASGITVYQRQDYRLARGPDGQPLVKQRVGDFVFRVPTMSQYVDIGVQRAARLRGLPVDWFTGYYAEALVTLPLVVVAKPAEFPAWEALLYPRDLEPVLAVFEAYTAGLEQF